MKTSWFDIGYDAGLSGEFNPPENSFARNSYRLGYEAGEWFATCTVEGWPVKTREQAKKAAGYDA